MHRNRWSLVGIVLLVVFTNAGTVRTGWAQETPDTPDFAAAIGETDVMTPLRVLADEIGARPVGSDAERAALDFALAAGAVPNAVDTEVMDRMKEHWSEKQIVQILGAVCLYGFLNRWNDSMATDLEGAPRAMGERVLAKGGWTGGKHL